MKSQWLAAKDLPSQYLLSWGSQYINSSCLLITYSVQSWVPWFLCNPQPSALPSSPSQWLYSLSLSLHPHSLTTPLCLITLTHTLQDEALLRLTGISTNTIKQIPSVCGFHVTYSSFREWLVQSPTWDTMIAFSILTMKNHVYNGSTSVTMEMI